MDVDADVDVDVDVDVRTTINNFGDFIGTEIVSPLNSDTTWEIGIQETKLNCANCVYFSHVTSPQGLSSLFVVSSVKWDTSNSVKDFHIFNVSYSQKLFLWPKVTVIQVENKKIHFQILSFILSNTRRSELNSSINR